MLGGIRRISSAFNLFLNKIVNIVPKYFNFTIRSNDLLATFVLL